MAPEQVPSIGRVVHFVYGEKHVPAIITDPAFVVETDAVHQVEQALTVFPVFEAPFVTSAPYDAEGKRPASWHWPEYVPAKG